MLQNSDNEYWMSIALEMANHALISDEVPVGAVIIKENKLISKASNSPISAIDPTAHAEINAIRKASENLGNYRLTGATLYSTLEPCAMCYGAIVHARISMLVFGAYDPKTGVCGSSIKLHEQGCFNHTPDILGGALEEDCSLILKDFFKEKRI